MTATNLDQLATIWSQVEALAPGLLHPIETEEQYQQALETVDELMTRVNQAEGDDPLESLLGILIERVTVYEESIIPPREKKPAGVLAYLMEDRGLTQSALADRGSARNRILSSSKWLGRWQGWRLQCKRKSW